MIASPVSSGFHLRGHSHLSSSVMSPQREKKETDESSKSKRKNRVMIMSNKFDQNKSS